MKKIFSLIFATLMGAMLLFSCDGIDTIDRTKEKQQDNLITLGFLYQNNQITNLYEMVTKLQITLVNLSIRVEVLEADSATKEELYTAINNLRTELTNIINNNEKDCSEQLAAIIARIDALELRLDGRIDALELRVSALEAIDFATKQYVIDAINSLNSSLMIIINENEKDCSDELKSIKERLTALESITTGSIVTVFTPLPQFDGKLVIIKIVNGADKQYVATDSVKIKDPHEWEICWKSTSLLTPGVYYKYGSTFFHITETSVVKD